MSTILLWAEKGIYFTALQGVYVLSSGEYLCLDQNGLYLVSASDEDDVEQITVVTLGVFGGYSNLSELIDRFNAANGSYIVEVIDYGTDSDALTNLNLDLEYTM